jgi:hypothetical protein
MYKQAQERILARQTARELSLDEIKNVSGAFSFPSAPSASWTSTSSNSKSTVCTNGVCKTVSSRDE